MSTIFLRPTYETYGTPADDGFSYEAKRLAVGEGREVSIWHVRAEKPRAIVVVVPASDRNKSLYAPAVPIFVPAGYDVILMDYEGFGESTGSIFDLDIARLPEDALAVVDYALTQNPHVVVFGLSTGGASAVYAATQRALTAVILEAPLVLNREAELWLDSQGVQNPAAGQIANFWVGVQMPPTFDIVRNIADVAEPKLIMQSPEDQVVPYAAGRLVYDAAPEPKTFVELKGGHIEMIKLDPETYAHTMLGWLDHELSAAG